MTLSQPNNHSVFCNPTPTHSFFVEFVPSHKFYPNHIRIDVTCHDLDEATHIAFGVLEELYTEEWVLLHTHPNPLPANSRLLAILQVQ